MRPSPFTYSKPRNLSDALELMNNGAIPIAGGQSLLQGMRLRTEHPSAVVDISELNELSASIELSRDYVTVGALVTHRTFLEDEAINNEFPWLAKAARDLGDVQVRNRGTVLGNVCWADPRANLCVALLASGAKVLVAGTEQETISIEDFFLGYRRNALNGRLAGSIRLTRHAQAIGSYQEFSRQTQDLALCNVCVVHNERGTAIAIGGIHQQPVRLGNLERILSKPDSTIKNLNSDIVASLDEMSLTPIIDHHGTPEFKLDVAATLIERAINQCMRGGDHV